MRLRKTGPAVGQLLRLLAEAFDHKSWHGTNLLGSVRRLDARRAGWRPGPGRHNAWEITVHAAYWKYTVRRRLTGEKRGAFALKGSNWFERPDPGGDSEWRADVRLLVSEHRRLLEAVRRLRDADLEVRPAGSTFELGGLIRGAASHDLYHAGQIQVLKRLCPR